nr:hypothetical protein [Tanacetum cinerariifolium]
MTPSTIATITTSRDAPILPTTIPSIILENLPTFNSAFRFDERLRSLETTFSEYRQTNPFVDTVSAILGIVHQYMTQQMTKAVREAVQIQTDWLQDSLQRENDEFLRNIDENIKKIIKGQVKSQVKEQVLRRSTTGSQSRQLSASESAFAEEPVQTTCQMEEPLYPVFEIGAEDQPSVQTSQQPEWFSQPMRPPSPDRVATLTPKLLAGPTYKLMRGSCNSLTELKYHLEEVYKATTDQLDMVNPEGQQYPHNLLQPLSLIPDNRGRRVIPFDHFINNDLEYYGFAVNRESALDVYSKRRIIA